MGLTTRGIAWGWSKKGRQNSVEEDTEGLGDSSSTGSVMSTPGNQFFLFPASLLIRTQPWEDLESMSCVMEFLLFTFCLAGL